MPHLCVNIDHVATLRNARQTYEPDPLWAALAVHLAGAAGVTLHLREDRRHIQDNDLRRLKENVVIKLNLEMAATDEMLQIALKTCPDMAMLVPEGRQEITTEGGLDILKNYHQVAKVIEQLKNKGIQSSVFIDADEKQIQAAAKIGADVCEIHTGPYAHAFFQNGKSLDNPKVLKEYLKIKEAGDLIIQNHMRFNAGHALNYYNVLPIAKLQNLSELHIGHSIISRAIFKGLENAVREMNGLIQNAK